MRTRTLPLALVVLAAVSARAPSNALAPVPLAGTTVGVEEHLGNAHGGDIADAGAEERRTEIGGLVPHAADQVDGAGRGEPTGHHPGGISRPAAGDFTLNADAVGDRRRDVAPENEAADPGIGTADQLTTDAHRVQARLGLLLRAGERRNEQKRQERERA